MNTPPPFDGDRFESWKGRVKKFLKVNGFEIWDYIIDDPFILFIVLIIKQ